MTLKTVADLPVGPRGIERTATIETLRGVWDLGTDDAAAYLDAVETVAWVETGHALTGMLPYGPEHLTESTDHHALTTTRVYAEACGCVFSEVWGIAATNLLSDERTPCWEHLDVDERAGTPHYVGRMYV